VKVAACSRVVASLLAVTLVASCADATDRPPRIEVKNAPSEADRRAAQKALEQDFAALASDDARAILAAENRRNDDLEKSLGGAATARRKACAALELEIAKLAELKVAAATAAERDEVDLALNTSNAKAAEICQ
jgi:hypothetical protein